MKLPFTGSEPVEGARAICKIPNVRAEKNKKIGTLGSKVPTKMDKHCNGCVLFDEISNLQLKGISRNNNEDRGPITSSTVFHSLKFKAMQDVHLCMYVCMHVCMYVYVSQGDFRLMSFTAGRCGTPLILQRPVL